ncbi:MAG: GHMP kinase [candidate division KSB1 bacterium]|nr:GHMP kinase [candidate division KSB1 bacterium]MDZ7345919.1 GHMP kinase [candidate division KSB1 bacterium]
MAKTVTVSAPGRICLFGEHQDYLGLAVITAAIDLRIRIRGRSTSDRKIRLHLPDLNEYACFDLIYPFHYTEERDYFKSTLNILQREGAELPFGVEALVRGRIPINSGTSSSSALVVAWTAFLLAMMRDPRAGDPLTIARLAHRAEVVEFREPGGQMDHFASAFGGLLFIDFGSETPPQRLPAKLGAFVLGDSREPKDTKGILARVKGGVMDALRILGKSAGQVTLEDVERNAARLSTEQQQLLRAQIVDRELTLEAYRLLSTPEVDHRRFGEMLTAHHEQLRDGLRISTPKIDRMLDAARKAGAYGGKINGSGGGGCMFAYAPENTPKVAEAVAEQGGRAYIVRIAEGVRIEEMVE